MRIQSSGGGHTDGVIRRRFAVTGVVLAALIGEWLGHGVACYRVAGIPGLQAGLGGGVHDYMLPLAAALLAAAVASAARLTQAWLALGRRLDASAHLLARLRAGNRRIGSLPPALADGRMGRAPSLVARTLALALPLAALQCGLYLAQENLERVFHRLPATGLAPLVGGGGAGAWIQGGIALVLAAVLASALSLFRSRRGAVQRCERLARTLWQRVHRAPVARRPAHRDQVSPARLLLGTALWQRPPPVPSPA